MSIPTLRILIVDDQTVMRKGLEALLRSPRYGLEVVGEAGDGQEAVRLAADLQPDVILMDILMPVMDGLEATRRICQANPTARILILTSLEQHHRVAEALQVGATGYVLKDTSPDDLVNAIRNVASGHTAVRRDLLMSALSQPGSVLSGENFPSEIDLSQLTDREREVAHWIQQGYSNQQIAIHMQISLNTVRTHVSSILRKLSLENRTQIALLSRHNP
jgi:DNA-binding NarL/FixJ family response regulator